MNTKTCKGCGWVYPVTQHGLKCKICRTPFDIVKCNRCGILVPPEKLGTNRVCKKCNAELCAPTSRAYRRRRKAAQEAAYNAILDKVRQVPSNYPTLTEAQWLEACRYFNGCALCGTANIDARCLLISFELGGRYCDWNVIPVCETCATKWKGTYNLLSQAMGIDHQNRSSTRRKQMEKILTYIGGKLDGCSGT